MARMTVDQIIERVAKKLRDDNFDTEDILMALNQCNIDIATEVDIKQLATVTELTFPSTGTTVPFPTAEGLAYHKNFVHAFNKTTNSNIKVVDSRRVIDRRIGYRHGGNVMIAAEDGPNVYYQFQPSSDQIVDIYYHRLPDDLVEGGEFPDYIPNNYIYSLYFNFACATLYDYKEDGIEGEKVNTLYHEDKYSKQLKKFELYMQPDPDLPKQQDNDDFNFEIYE